MASASSAPESLEPGMMAFLEDFHTLQPSADGLALRDQSLVLGHLDLYFKEGGLFPLKTRGGVSLGWFFSGEGRLLYRSEEVGDRQALAVNLSRRKSAPRYQGGVVTDPFTRLVIFTPSYALQDLMKSSGDAAGVASPPAASRTLDAAGKSAFLQIWGGIERTQLACDHLAVEARMNGGGLRYLLVETAGGTRPIGYELDGIEEQTERLFLLEDLADLGIRARQQLSRQRLEGSAGRETAGLALKDIHLSLATEDNHRAVITSDLTCRVDGARVKVARFSLMNNRNPYSADWTSTRNQLRVISVVNEEGRRLPFSHTANELLVELPKGYVPGEYVMLRVQTEGEVLTGLGGKEQDNYFELMNEAWFPQPGFWTQSGFTFSMNVKTHKPYRPVAMGKTVVFKEDGETYELSTESLRPVRWLAVLAGNYIARGMTVDNLTVNIYAYASARQQTLDLLAPLSVDLVRFYESLLGPYQSGELAIVEVPYFTQEGVAFGMASPGLVLMTSEAYRARGQWDTEYFSRGVNARLAHEIAHQWFGATAIPMRREDAWLSESLAEYLSGLAMGSSDSERRGVVGFNQMFAEWRSNAKGCQDSGSLETAGELAGDKGWMDRTCLLYNRGPLVLHMLRTLSGNETFFHILRLYLEKAKSGDATTAAFQAAAEEVLKQDVGWFFDSWYRSGGIPEIQVSHRLELQSQTILVARAAQAEGPGFKKVIIPFVLEYGGGRREVKLLFQDKPVTEARFVLGSRPQKILVDPGQNNLAVYRQVP